MTVQVKGAMFILGVLLLVFSPLFSQQLPEPTPEEKIKESLYILSKGYEKEDITLAMSVYSKAYRGLNNETYTDVKQRIEKIFSALKGQEKLRNQLRNGYVNDYVTENRTRKQRT